jgi:hypothetical protein
MFVRKVGRVTTFFFIIKTDYFPICWKKYIWNFEKDIYHTRACFCGDVINTVLKFKSDASSLNKTLKHNCIRNTYDLATAVFQACFESIVFEAGLETIVFEAGLECIIF